MLNHHILKKAVILIVLLLIFISTLNVLEIAVLGSIWFIILFSLLGIILPTLIWTKINDDRKSKP